MARPLNTQPRYYLRDPTGNRRYWPVTVGRIDLKGFDQVVAQLWAEASGREAKGESITLSEELWAVASEAQARRLAEDPFADVLGAEFADTAGRVPMEAVKAILGIETARTLRVQHKLFEGLNDARNKRSFAHDNELLAVSEAQFIVDSVLASLAFIERIEADRKGVCSNLDEEFPF